ncbi:MAG TPA: hypothetical protein VJK02_08575 [Anaerolineales bacterium]|nr:hypothetical protein [Anaerolineales bacterium]
MNDATAASSMGSEEKEFPHLLHLLGNSVNPTAGRVRQEIKIDDIQEIKRKTGFLRQGNSMGNRGLTGWSTTNGTHNPGH